MRPFLLHDGVDKGGTVEERQPRLAHVGAGDGGEYQAAAAAPRGDPQAAHAPTT